VRHSPLASEKLTIIRKRYKIGGKLVGLLITNRKSYMSFRLVLKSVTLNNPERRNGRYKKFTYVMDGQTLDTVDSEKDLGVMISYDLKSSNQCIQAYSKANKMLGIITRNSSDDIANPELSLRQHRTPTA